MRTIKTSVAQLGMADESVTIISRSKEECQARRHSAPAMAMPKYKHLKGDCPVVVMKQSNFRGAKRAGHPRHDESTGNRMNSEIGRKAPAFIGWHEPDKSRGLR